jgi:hypothetical protein
MTTTNRVPTAALVLSLIMTLAACSGSPTTTSVPTPSVSAGAATPTAQATPSALGRTEGDLEAGTHILDLTALDHLLGTGPGPTQLPKIEITVPDGWYNGGGWVVRTTGDFVVAVMFWDVDEVYPTPCKWAGKPMVDPGRDVDGLVSVLADQPLRNATAPTDVVLDGFSGTYLELSVPTDVAFSDCDEGFFESWTGNGWASDRYQQAPGQIDRLWILDVEGERLVVDASYVPGATEQDLNELADVVESIRFVE